MVECNFKTKKYDKDTCKLLVRPRKYPKCNGERCIFQKILKGLQSANAAQEKSIETEIEKPQCPNCSSFQMCKTPYNECNGEFFKPKTKISHTENQLNREEWKKQSPDHAPFLHQRDSEPKAENLQDEVNRRKEEVYDKLVE